MNLDHENYKVCHITSAHPDGDIRIFHKSCVTLANAGFETYCIVPNAVSRMEKGVKIVGFSIQKGSRLRRFIFTVNQAYREALAIQADVYHLHDPELLLIARKLKRKTGAQVIFDSHEDVPKQIMDKPWIPSLFRGMVSKIYAAFEKRVCKKLDAVISVTPLICKRFAAFHPRVELVANFPDLQEFDLDSPEKSNETIRKACYVGGLFETRGIRELVQSLELIDVELHLAGLFSSPQFEKEIKALPGWKKVVYYGQIDRKAIQDLFAKTSVGVVTLLPTASYMEAYPIKMFEYMAAGLAVLASDFPLYRELVEQYTCAEFVNPTDPKLIAEKLDAMFDNPDLLIWGQNGRKAIIEKINWSHEGAKLVCLYEQLLTHKVV